MHSSSELSAPDFEIRLEDHAASITDILPAFGEQSRLGIVVRDGYGAIGASGLLMAAVTAFYDELREHYPEGFFRYADFFIFHVGQPHGNHHMLDVYPDHKEVLVEDDPEQILRAINDRGVTHLLVPEGVPGDPRFEPQTLNGAKARIKAAIVYGPRGEVANPDIEVKGTERVDYYVEATLDAAGWIDKFEAEGGEPDVVAWARSRLGEVDDATVAQLGASRDALQVNGRTAESYRRVDLDTALALLAAGPPAA